ncbi:Hypothetical predicted protein [Pelobates cultripes]|uniref:Thrombospondin-like N-terminal domain-containing protein n=1 Tax=Pelobates cultripes TaxID=61616 RepID=A0AAD1WEY3_PELCU|nr:Hypothetical predicted protein [Pelobates cultripes]
MHLGTQRTRSGNSSPTARAIRFVFLIAICRAVGVADGQGINILQKLKAEDKTFSPLATASTPLWFSGAEAYKGKLAGGGLVLTPHTIIEFPVEKLLPFSFGSSFSVLISLRSDKLNNAFLFSIRNKNRLYFGVQLLPRKVVVHLDGKQSVSFDYSVHDGEWHSFALSIGEKSVALFSECGEKNLIKKVTLGTQNFGLGSVFTIGRMNLNSAQFEGAICQLEIIPSAEASTNYCQYVKQQCRQADTYRSTFQTAGGALVTNRNIKNEMQSSQNKNSNLISNSTASPSNSSIRNTTKPDRSLLPKTTDVDSLKDETKIQRIFNRTLYRSSISTPRQSHVDSWYQGFYDEDHHYNPENSYENYDYDYEEINSMFEMEQLRGGKGDLGPPNRSGIQTKSGKDTFQQQPAKAHKRHFLTAVNGRSPSINRFCITSKQGLCLPESFMEAEALWF